MSAQVSLRSLITRLAEFVVWVASVTLVATLPWAGFAFLAFVASTPEVHCVFLVGLAASGLLLFVIARRRKRMRGHDAEFPPRAGPEACFGAALRYFHRGELKLALRSLERNAPGERHPPSAALRAVIDALCGDFVQARAWLGIARASRSRGSRHISLCATTEALLHAADRDVDAFTAAAKCVVAKDVGAPLFGVLQFLADDLARNGQEARWQLAPVVRDGKNPLLRQLLVLWPLLDDRVETRL